MTEKTFCKRDNLDVGVEQQVRPYRRLGGNLWEGQQNYF
jgi:hypothetical protein